MGRARDGIQRQKAQQSLEAKNKAEEPRSSMMHEAWMHKGELSRQKNGAKSWRSSCRGRSYFVQSENAACTCWKSGPVSTAQQRSGDCPLELSAASSACHHQTAQLAVCKN